MFRGDSSPGTRATAVAMAETDVNLLNKEFPTEGLKKRRAQCPAKWSRWKINTEINQGLMERDARQKATEKQEI